MLKETREIKRVETYDVYIAIDGTEFRDAEECKKYDKTAEAAINARFKDRLGVDPYGSISAGGLYMMNMGCDDGYLCIEPKTQEDIDCINMIVNPYGTAYVHTFKAEDIGKKHILLCTEDGEYYYEGTAEVLRKKLDWNYNCIINNRIPCCGDCIHYNKETGRCDGTDSYRSSESISDISKCTGCHMFEERK